MPVLPPHPPSPLRRARAARGWSQRQVAEAVGTNRFTVTRWELGLAFPSPHFRQQLIRLFGLAPEALGLVPSGEPSTHLSHVLPPLAPSSGLIGRETLLAQLKARLFDEGTLVLSALQGLPGVGKTTLALALGHDPEVLAHFADGVLWASVGPHPPLLAHLQRWGSALGWSKEDLAPLQDLAALGKALQASIGQRRLLLIMDDLWQVEDALALKIGGPHCTHLVTTRLPVVAHHLASEHTFPVPELGDDDSLALLHHLAPTSTAAYPEAIHALIRQVGGLPLALQLIGHALRVQELSGQPRRVEQAIQQLQRAEARFHLREASAPADTPPALQAGTPLSLEAIINVSVQALTARAQAMLCALAVFPARPISFSEEAALSVCGLERQDGLDGLDALLDAGLVESVGPARYTIHLTIADFERITHPHLQQAQERYVRYYAGLTQACQDDYARLEGELQHLTAAFQLAYDLQLWDALIPAIVAFAPFGLARGFYTLLATHLKQALEGAERLQDHQHCCDLLNALADAAERQGAYTASQAYAEQALALARKVQSLPAISKALQVLGVVYLNAGKTQLAQASLEEGLTIATRIGNDDLCTRILVTFGRLMNITGNHTQAEALLQQGLAIARQHAWHEQAVGIYGNLGVSSAVQGQLAQAERFFTEALAEARIIGWRECIAKALINLGAATLAQGNLEKAEGLLLEGLAVARDIGSRERVVGSLINLGELTAAQNRYEQAERYALEGLLLAREIGHLDRLAAILYVAGLIACRQQKFAEAQAFQAEGSALARTTKHQRHIGQFLYLQGECALSQGHLSEATTAFQEALALAEARHYQDIKGLALFGLAQVLHRQGETAQAHAKDLEAFHLLQSIPYHSAPVVQRWLETTAAEVSPSTTPGTSSQNHPGSP